MSATIPRLPGYAVERLLGRGGSGEVWAARVRATGEPVALKWISNGDRPAGTREAALLTALDHPHLVRVHDVVPDRDGAALVLDLADGGSLADLLAARGRITAGEAVTALSPIASALAHAHANGVVHGDVTPGNILFTADGLPLLADLGVARLRGDSAALDGTRCTPEYVDPAVAAGSVPRPPSDVFMLAAVAVHALTGAPIWAGATADERLQAAADGDVGDLAGRLHAAAVPDTVAAVVLRGASVDPTLRGSAAEFALDLRHAAEPVPVDLHAGRPRAPAQVDAARPALTRSGPRHAAQSSGGGASAVFTRLLRPRPRPQIARAHRRLSLPGLDRRQGIVAAIAALVLTGAGVAWGLGVWTPAAHRSAPTVAPTEGQPLALPPGLDESLASQTADNATQTATTPTSAPPVLTAASAAQVLAGLDDLRQHAFALREPVLLTGVYPQGKLLTDDTALLLKLVPRNCGLQGVHTAYANVSIVSQSDSGVVVSAQATLAPSVLVCGTTATAQAAGSKALPVRITLVWRGNGYLIGDVRNQ